MAERIDLTETPIPAPRRPVRYGTGRGTGSSRLDSFARGLIAPAAIISGLLVLYLLTGLFSGSWSHEALVQLTASRRRQQLDNIGLVFDLLEVSSLVTLVSLLVCCARVEGIGYWLLGGGALFYAGPSLLTGQIDLYRHQTAGLAGRAALDDFQILAWFFAVPGALLTVVDLARRMGSAAEQAAIQRANAKYGAGTGKQPVSTQRKVFLGRCWEGPFCRDHIRVKCPIYLKRRGPCWWYKEGCMCEERIVLQAMISPDWKEKISQAQKALEMGGPRPVLSPEAKRERCRNCVIYNEHQRQKYKALSWLTLIAVPALLFLNLAWLQGIVNSVLFALDTATKRFSFGSNPIGISALQANNAAYSMIAWVFLFSLAIILLSQVLKTIEYACFKLKI